MSFQRFPPPPLPPRQLGNAVPPPSVPLRKPVGGGPPPPVPVSSRPAVTQAPLPHAPRSVLDDPEVISWCPEDDVLHATAYWYTASDTPGVEICSHCFASHIRDTHWASRFERQLKRSDPDRRCRFSTPRMLQLWPQVLHNNDWAYIRNYMLRRAKIPNCRGLTPQSNDVGTQWYSLRNRDINNFGICAACYEDIALATPFGNRFEPNPTGQPAGELWNCKMTPYASRAFERFGISNNWQQLVSSVGYAMNLPPCDGAVGVPAMNKKWYRPKRFIDGFVICEACYFHFVAASFMEGEWSPPIQVSAMDGGWNQWACDMHLAPMKVAYMKSSHEKNFGIFWNAAKDIIASPPCRAEGSHGGSWYRLRRQCDEFDVCPQCFAGLFNALGFGNNFVRVELGLHEARTCSMNASDPRQAKYFNKLDESISTRDFSKFETFAIRYAHIPVCPTNVMVSGHKWFGTDDFLACENCWEDFVKDTALASRITYRGATFPQAYCSMYSTRMRQLWLQACAKGDLTEFVAFAKHRAEVYKQTVPRMQEILAITKMRMATKQTLLMSSVMLSGANNIVAASRDANIYTSYGNPSIGYGYATMAGAQGASQFNQAIGMNVVDGNEMMQVSQLEAIWRQVE